MESVVVIINGRCLGRFALASCNQTELRLVSVPMKDRLLSDFQGLLSVRPCNCLKNAQLKTVGDLASKSEEELLKTKFFGRKSVEEAMAFLALLQGKLYKKFDQPKLGKEVIVMAQANAGSAGKTRKGKQVR